MVIVNKGEGFVKNSPDYIFVNGKIVTVDEDFSIKKAVAIEGKHFVAVGTNKEIEGLADTSTKKIDLEGKTVIPGLIDAHTHLAWAAVSELYQEIPDVYSVKDTLSWIRSQAKVKGKGDWIIFPKFFPARLKEMRWPTKLELDTVAPENPVFLEGGYAGVINSCALRVSGITKDIADPGILKNPVTEELTGKIKASAFKLIKEKPYKDLPYERKLNALKNMIKRYNSVGITSFTEGMQSPADLKIYIDLWKRDWLTARVFVNIKVDLEGSIENIRRQLNSLGFCTGFGNSMVRIGSLKIVMDGGILTGTAYMRDPWGVKAKEAFEIDSPLSRGVLNYSKEQLLSMVSVANEIGWKVAVHCCGDGAVDILLDVYEEVNRKKSIREQRFSIIHGDFLTPQAMKKCRRLGVVLECQPAWLYKDADVMRYILGNERIRTFLPLRSILDAGVVISGGSDHMAKFDSYTSINPYNPFLGMWIVITRKTERGSVTEPNQRISREEALKMYTINNAFDTFEENTKGSIEPGKLADMVVISEDILTCPVDEIKDIKVELTMLGGEVVYSERGDLMRRRLD